MAKLVINSGTPQAREFELKPGTNFVGRGFANDLTIEDPSVSTSHAQIILDGDLVSVKDLGSTNGTFINGQPVKEAVLQPGQLLRLGGVEMIFQADAASAVAAVAAAPAVALGAALPPIGSAQIASPPIPPPPTASRLRAGNASSTPTTLLAREAAPEVAEAPPPPPPTREMVEFARGEIRLQISSKKPGAMAVPEMQPPFLFPLRGHAPHRRRHGILLPHLRRRMFAGEGEIRREQGEGGKGILRCHGAGSLHRIRFWRSGVGRDILGSHWLDGRGIALHPRAVSMLGDGCVDWICGEDRLSGPPGNHIFIDRRGVLPAGHTLWRICHDHGGSPGSFGNLRSAGGDGRHVYGVEDWRRRFLKARPGSEHSWNGAKTGGPLLERTHYRPSKARPECGTSEWMLGQGEGRSYSSWYRLNSSWSGSCR